MRPRSMPLVLITRLRVGRSLSEPAGSDMASATSAASVRGRCLVRPRCERTGPCRRPSSGQRALHLICTDRAAPSRTTPGNFQAPQDRRLRAADLVIRSHTASRKGNDLLGGTGGWASRPDRPLRGDIANTPATLPEGYCRQARQPRYAASNSLPRHLSTPTFR